MRYGPSGWTCQQARCDESVILKRRVKRQRTSTVRGQHMHNWHGQACPAIPLFNTLRMSAAFRRASVAMSRSLSFSNT